MKLSELLQGIEYRIIKGNTEIDINMLAYDSRKVTKGAVFFCIEGYNVDGHDFIKAALENGAIAVICSKEINLPKDCTVIRVEDSRKAIAIASANYYHHPERKMKIIGITGTNGKTTTAYMLKAIFEAAGFNVAVIGTIANYIKGKKLPTERTTPEALELFKLFNDMVEEKIAYCIMEVSSHSLSLKRIYGINFSQGIFTNITRDHLDFHKTFEDYYAAKLKLFEHSKISILNLDNEYGIRAYEDIEGEKYTFKIEDFVDSPIKVDLLAKIIHFDSKCSNFDIYFKEILENIQLGIPGRYNISNALGSIMVAINEEVDMEFIKKGLEKVSVPGRFEVVSSKYNLNFDIYLDYAHTPDGLENIINTINSIKKKRLISVFGCGGNRDKIKRPMMGKIGTELSDFAIITSDNPRKEEPSSIINDILVGVEKDNYLVIINRREAIKKAIEMAEEGDVVLIAGKGHENYQILMDETIHFDEREVVDDILRSCDK